MATLMKGTLVGNEKLGCRKRGCNKWGGLKGCLAALPGNRPKSAFFGLFLAFFCLFRPFPEGAKSTWEIQKTEEKGLFPLSDRSFFVDVRAACPCQNACFFQDLEGLTEVFGRMSAGTSGRKLPLWADFSLLIWEGVSLSRVLTSDFKVVLLRAIPALVADYFDVVLAAWRAPCLPR